MGVPHVGCVMLRRQLHGYIKPSQRQADSHHLDHPDPASKLMFSHHVGSRLAMPFDSFNMGIENKHVLLLKVYKSSISGPCSMAMLNNQRVHQIIQNVQHNFVLKPMG
jgi:hypothetical protein